MRVLHTSDLHGAYKKLLAFDEPFDLWLDTGDFFPNRGRVPATGYRIDPLRERPFQYRWWRLKKLGARIERWLAGRPALSVAGNHDFVSLRGLLLGAGVQAHAVSPESTEVFGLRWAGFRHIPSMQGEWPGETDDFDAMVRETLCGDPDVVATHAPPSGILDGHGPYGIPPLGQAIRSGAHGVRACFFGHEHGDGGKHRRVGDTDCYNGAERLRVVELGGRGPRQ